MNFETDRIDDCVEFMKQLKIKQQKLNGSRPGELCVMATGGGAYKFYDKIHEALGVDVIREDEMECLIIGMVSPILRFFNISKLSSIDMCAQALISLSQKFPAKSSPTAKQTQCTSKSRAQISIPISS
jgi:type II pantothenate kinase